MLHLNPNFPALFLTLLTLSAASVPKAPPKRIMPLGASIVSGCWRAHLSTLLNAASLPFDFVGTLSGPTNCGIPFDADHEGHSGFKATGIVGNDTFLPSWLRATRPDVVMMLLGTNDVWGGGITAEEILKAYEGLVGDMRTENDDMRILIAQLPPMRPSNCADCYERVKELNRAIMAWVPGQSTPRSRITVVDAWTPFNTTEDMRDGVHPNEGSGTRKMAEVWFGPLSGVLREG